MSLLRIGRGLLRGFAKLAKVIEQKPVLIQTKWTVVTVKPKTNFLWSSLESFRGRNVISNIRRNASKDFLKRYATNFCLVSFVSCYLKEDENHNDATSFSSLVTAVQSSFEHAIYNDKNSEPYPSEISKYNIQKRLGDQSSSAAVYEADWNGKECAVKVMFNYHTSSSSAIYQAFHREFQVLSLNEESKPLKRHPNIVKLLGKFVDKTPIFYDSKESYPSAVPRQYSSNGYGRSQTLFLVMPKYSCTLWEYLQQNSNTLTFEDRMNLFQQLLEGVAHLESKSISHRDLKGDNVLIKKNGDQTELVITDFGCCLIGNVLSYETDHVDKGGNVALMAPEIISATPGKGVIIDYSRADAWAVGTLAYEIFGHDNPFYMLRSADYNHKDLPLLNSGHNLLDTVVDKLLQRNPEERLSAHQAATILFLISNAPKHWFETNPVNNISQPEIQRWILEFSILSIRKCIQHGMIFSMETQMAIVFLSRVSVADIIDAIVFIWDS